MTESKKTVRAAARSINAGLDARYEAESDCGIFENLVSLEEYASARTVFAYLSEHPEPDTRKFIARAFADGKTVALPQTEASGEMRACVVSALDELVPGIWGIPEPPDGAPELAADGIDLILVPGLAFTREGVRLGRGAGYYDRFLKRTGAYTVGVCREALIFPRIPEREHDVRVQCIVTEKGAARLR